MKKLILVIFAGCIGLASVGASAQDTMKKHETMNKDGQENDIKKDVTPKPPVKKHKKMMKKDGMGKDGMSKDGMSKDGMSKDGMGKDEMGKDGMGKDGMGKDKMSQ